MSYVILPWSKSLFPLQQYICSALCKYVCTIAFEVLDINYLEIMYLLIIQCEQLHSTSQHEINARYMEIYAAAYIMCEAAWSVKTKSLLLHATACHIKFMLTKFPTHRPNIISTHIHKRMNGVIVIQLQLLTLYSHI